VTSVSGQDRLQVSAAPAVRLLGAVRFVNDDGHAVDLPSASQRRLLAALALAAGATLRPDYLSDLLDVSAGALRTTVSRLRSRLGEAVIRTDAVGYRIMCPVDADLFTGLGQRHRGVDVAEPRRRREQHSLRHHGVSLAGRGCVGTGTSRCRATLARPAEAGGHMSEERLPEPTSRRLSGGAIASLAGVVVLLLFILQNTKDVRFHFLFFSFTWPLWLYTIVTAAVGALVWLGVGVMRRHRRRKDRRDDRHD
jgi:uncharacterized integral membrane protein